MSEQANDNQEIVEPDDFGVKDFLIGGQIRTLKFTAATRFRLFKDIPDEQIQGYVSTTAFKLQSVALLVFGKEALSKSLDEIFDALEEIDMADHELALINEWVLKRTLNFMVKEAEHLAKLLKEQIPKVTELSNTLTSLQT